MNQLSCLTHQVFHPLTLPFPLSLAVYGVRPKTTWHLKNPKSWNIWEFVVSLVSRPHLRTWRIGIAIISKSDLTLHLFHPLSFPFFFNRISVQIQSTRGETQSYLLVVHLPTDQCGRRTPSSSQTP